MPDGGYTTDLVVFAPESLPILPNKVRIVSDPRGDQLKVSHPMEQLRLMV